MIKMQKLQRLRCVMVAVCLLGLIACHKNVDEVQNQSLNENASLQTMIDEQGVNPDELIFTSDALLLDQRGSEKQHFVYTESNAAGTNSILIFQILSNGALESAGEEPSGGAGLGMGLGSQGAVVIDERKEWLFAVNAGSNSVSSFKVYSDGTLKLAHTAASGGTKPVSLSVSNGLLYVLNTGSDNIFGLKIGAGGTLTPIEGSTQALSGNMVDAPQISFAPNGRWLIVTEKATNKIGSFKVKSDGSAEPGIFTASTGITPFGFEFARNRIMVVSNAAGGAPGAGSATAYKISGNGVPDDINGAVESMQAAPCWVAVTRHGCFAFVSNTGSNTVSSYYVAPCGALYLVNPAAASTGNAPADIVVASNNYFVYEVNGMSATIGAYHRTRFGGLNHISDASGLPAGVAGLATF
jgi:6-phosphogluconolactonase